MITARAVRQILGSLFFGALIGAGLMAVAIIRSPHSHADPYSDKEKDLMFLQEVSQIATVQDGPSLITHAKEGCIAALIEHNPHRIADIMWPFAKSLSTDEISRVAGVTASYYCPVVLSWISQPGEVGIV